MRRLIAGLLAGSIVLLSAVPLLAADNLILAVPDWNQPDPVQYPGSGILPGAYPNWCSPTAGGNIMGYWEDVKGCVGLTDRQAFAASPAYPGTAGTWQQGLYHDGIIEMGWHMDTGGWQTPPVGPFPPFAGNTMVVNIFPGLLSYAKGGWTDNSYPVPGGGTGIVKVAYPQTNGFFETSMAGRNPTPLATMWASYKNQIDLGHPVEMSFDRWVALDTQNTVTVNGQTVHQWTWAAQPLSEGHSVVGVGYFTDLQNNDWFICQDGWSTTQQYVGVPVNYAVWVENDYITTVPEPATWTLVIVGILCLIGMSRRARR